MSQASRAYELARDALAGGGHEGEGDGRERVKRVRGMVKERIRGLPNMPEL